MEIKPGIYKHHKGAYYLVIGVFNHTETLEPFVVYVGSSGFWIRPLESFISAVNQSSPRFSFVREVTSGKVGQVLKDGGKI